MTDALEIGSPAYRKLGLIGNPFKLASREPAMGAIGELDANAALLRTFVAVDAQADADRAKPIWIDKSQRISNFFHISICVDLLGKMTTNGAFAVLPVQVPLESMRMGRVRAILSAVADLVTGPAFLPTLTAFTLATLNDPDTSLPEYAALGDIEARRAEFAANARAAVEKYFGEYDTEREGGESMDATLEIGEARENSLDPDPEEAETDDEGNVVVQTRPVPVPDERTEPKQGAVADYVIAYARAHVSPVVARSIHGYVTNGSVSATQELRVTKAPRKTLRALATFAGYRFRSVLILIDGLDQWPGVPEDLRYAIASTLSDLRLALSGRAILGLMASRGTAVELEEQFADAVVVCWDVPHPPAAPADGSLPLDFVRSWIESASLGSGADASIASAAEDVLGRIPADIEAFRATMESAVDHAADRGAERVEEQDVEHGLQHPAVSEEPV